MTTSAERLSSALQDRYRIEREVGAGGMATVYLAEDLKHKRKVAVKVLKPELAAVLGAERFVQEITTTASLQHPHILPLFDSGTAEGFLYYVMPFIQGETVRDKLNRETQLGVDEAVKIAVEVADALQYAHEQGVIHRDIKPENILLANGRPMVADFGIALAVSAAAGGRMTETGLSLGTPHYMSPEQATAEKEITGRSDIYSLGSVLYEMLAGVPPHEGGSAQQTIMRIITDVPRPVTDLRKSVPPNVAVALSKALEKLPADRFDSARSFAQALANPGFTAAGTHALAVAASSPIRSRLPWLVAAASLITTAAMVVFNASSTPPTDARPPWFVDLDVPPGAEFASGLALSSDGGTLLYGGPRSIWLRRAGSTTPAPIAGTDGGCCPALSPDGQQVAFIRGRNLHVVPVEGGDSRELATGFQSGDDIAWTADGYIVGATAGRSIGGGALIRVRATGGAVESFTRVDTLAGEALHWSPRALPGGRGVVFTILPLDRNDSLGLRIAVVGPDGGPHTVLMAGRVATYAPPGYLLVTLRDGEVVAVPFDRNARRLTGDPVPLFSVPRAAGTFTWKGYTAVAPTGTLVYVGGVEPTVEFVWVDRSGAPTPAGFDARFASGHASIAAGGDVIAFDATKDLDRPVIEVRDLRRQTSSRIELADGNVHDVSFAPDGQSLIFRVVAPGRQGIFTTTLGRLGELTELLADPNAFVPSISRDNRTLYYVRNGRGNLEFVAHPLGQPGSSAQVLAAGGISLDWKPRLSPDGRWLAFVDVSASGQQLFVRSADPGRTERWLVAPATGIPIQWAPSGRELFFFAHDSLMVAEVSTSPTFTVGRVRPLFPRRFGEFQVGADGRFLAARAVRGTSSIRLSLIDDWRGLLKERSR